MQVIDSEGYLKVKLIGGPAGPFVPYTGATGNVDLGEYEIKVGQLELDQTPTGTAGIAVMRWNDADGTADLGLKGGNVTLQIGQEQVTRVVNKTGVNLLEANYQAVRVDGAQGNRLKVALAQANNDANSADTLGLVTETINNNQEGFVTVSGLVRNINTTGSIQTETWLDGDVLYLSGTVAGQITNIKPAAPIHTVIMGYVVRAHATQGQIYVKVDNGYELDELHNVAITTPLNNQVLQYETATSLWKNKTISTGITIGTTAITSGTVGRVLFEGTGNVVQESANLFWDNTNSRLGVGTATPSAIIHSLGSVTASGAIGRANYLNNTLVASANSDVLVGLDIQPTFTNGAFTGVQNHAARIQGNTVIGATTYSTMLYSAIPKLFVNGGTYLNSTVLIGTNNIQFSGNNVTWENTGITNNLPEWRADATGIKFGNYLSLPLRISVGGVENARFFSTGNIGVNTTTDAGFKLDVNGTAIFRSNITLNSNALYIGANSAMQLSTASSDIYLSNGNTSRKIIFDLTGSGQFQFNNGNVLIGTTTDAGFKLDVNGTARVQGNAQFGTAFYWDNTNGRLGIGTNAPAYPMHLVGSRFAQTGTTLTAATTLYYISDNLSTVNNSYILFGVDINGGTVGFGSQAGTYLSTGKNGTGTARPLILHNYDAQPIIFANSNTERMRVVGSTGNFLINTTTDAGFKLDVNGTARVSGGVTSGIIGTAGILNLNRSSDGANVGFVRVESSGGGIQIGSGVNMFFSNNGRIVVNSTTTDASAIFKIDSTTQGFLSPRMTTTQINAIASPAEGLQVYNTTISHMCFYQAGSWVKINHSPM